MDGWIIMADAGNSFDLMITSSENMAENMSGAVGIELVGYIYIYVYIYQWKYVYIYQWKYVYIYIRLSRGIIRNGADPENQRISLRKRQNFLKADGEILSEEK